jgi:hypothetical protein
LRYLREESDLQERMPSLFASAVAVQTLGQYSLAKNVSIFALSRADIYLRPAMHEEALQDFKTFGEQVMGEEVTSQNTTQPTISFMGVDYLYSGPPRAERFVHTLRVASGSNPTKEILNEIMAEIDEIIDPVKDRQERVMDCYVLVIADVGRIFMRGFKKMEDLDLENLQLLGQLEMDSDKLLFLPKGDRKKATDFSSTIYRR